MQMQLHRALARRLLSRSVYPLLSLIHYLILLNFELVESAVSYLHLNKIFEILQSRLVHVENRTKEGLGRLC